MENEKTKFWEEELNIALIHEQITNPDFFLFMKGKIKRIPFLVHEFGWGVFPIIDENGILKDIRMIVPVIYDIKSLCVNLHEYTHAYELYSYLEKHYEWHIEESEHKARSAEKRYLLSLNKDRFPNNNE